MTKQDFERWCAVPGNEIWANLDTQKMLPGMNARTFNAAPAVPESRKAGEIDSSPGIAAEPDALPEEMPATYSRQWRAPVSYVRGQNPGVDIMSWPNLVMTVQASADNVVRRIPVPPGAQLVRFSGSGGASGSLLVSKTRFVMPVVAVTGDIENWLEASLGAMISPFDQWWECQDTSEFFLGYGTSGTIISASFWIGQGPRTI